VRVERVCSIMSNEIQICSDMSKKVAKICQRFFIEWEIVFFRQFYWKNPRNSGFFLLWSWQKSFPIHLTWLFLLLIWYEKWYFRFEFYSFLFEDKNLCFYLFCFNFLFFWKKCRPWLNFISVLSTGFTHTDLESLKRYWWLNCIFYAFVIYERKSCK